MPTAVALIPARAGSKRLPGKNVRPLAGHPLIAYTIAPALASGVFRRVVVSTDSEEIADIARYYGAEVPSLRPAEMAGDLSPDIEWVTYTLRQLCDAGERPDCFSILRPTSPFRQPETIRRAWAEFAAHPQAHSLRAVELCKQHPGKMWVTQEQWIVPLLPDGRVNPPWHSTPYQALPRVYVQNASLEIARTEVVLDGGTIAGTRVVPFFTTGYEGLDVNDPKDFWYAEHLVATGEVVPATVSIRPWTPRPEPVSS